MPVPLFGEAPALEMSGETARQMWANGGPLPPETGLDPEKHLHIRRSDDGAWVVRMRVTLERDANEKRDIALRDYGRLSGLGLEVLNFTSVPSTSSLRLFTISPWVPDMVRCTEQEYDASVWPILNAYERLTREERRGNEVISPWELMAAEQHSWVGNPSPQGTFLHDVDPSYIDF